MHMNKVVKLFIGLGLFIGSTIGSFVPSLWGGSVFSISSIVFSAVGGIIGIWLGYKIGNSI